MPYDYTAWPTVADLTARLSQMGVELPNSFDDAAKQNAIDSAVALLTQITKRNFLPVTETRYFDGSGTGVIDVDPFQSLDSVAVIGYLGNLTSFAYNNVHAVKNNFGPSTQVQVYQGTYLNYGPFLVSTFPEGRSNVAVTATWGYGPTIPADLWNAVLTTAATMLARQNTFSPAGPLNQWQEGPVQETYRTLTPEELAQYPELMAAAARYGRPLGGRLKNRARRMV